MLLVRFGGSRGRGVYSVLSGGECGKEDRKIMRFTVTIGGKFTVRAVKSMLA